MKAIVITRHGSADQAFEIREYPNPAPLDHEVLIKADAFGLNFADVMARKGLYRDCPPLPAILGYEVVGEIAAVGNNVSNLAIGQRVMAFTRFGGYAKYAVVGQRGVVPIPDDMSNGVAAALATQYCTAYYSACEVTNLFEGDNVLIHAAAGGVGTALVQLAKMKGCTVFGTTSSEKKIEYLKKIGVDHPINYVNNDFSTEVNNILNGDRIDVVFDSIGGSTFKRSKQLLSAGGRIVSYGLADRLGRKGGKLAMLNIIMQYGFTHPLKLLVKSQSIVGVNLLRLADYRPRIIQRCLQNVVNLTLEGKLDPQVGAVFKADEIAEAHKLLESRQSVGKVIVEW